MNRFIEFLRKKRKIIIVSCLVFVGLFVGVFLAVKAFYGASNEVEHDEVFVKQEEVEEPKMSPSTNNLPDESEDTEEQEKKQEDIEDIGDIGDIENIEDIEDIFREDNNFDKQDPQVQNTTGVEVSMDQVDPKSDDNRVLVKGIDVAKWQGVIDWDKVKDSGITFAMIRVGYRTLDNGVIVEDPFAKYNLQEAEKNDIKIGAYFFSTAIDEKEAIEEAKWVADFIAPYSITYPVAYNCEGFNNPNNRQYGMSKESRTDIAIAFLDKIKEKGYTPMFYAAKNELKNDSQWLTSKLSPKYKIWLAHYPNELSDKMKSDYSGTYDMWQFTSKGSIPGIDNTVDLNIAYFDYDTIAQAKDDSNKEEVSADPAALINFKEVKELVTAKEKTNLRSLPSSQDPDTIVAVLLNQDTAVRTGIGDNGWSRLEYKGEVLYAVTSLLTTDLDYQPPTPSPKAKEPEIIYEEVREEVTAKYETNLRSEPSSISDETIVTTLKYGDLVIRTGIGDNGWSKLEYNGQTVYAITSYLTTDMNYQDNLE